MLRRVCSYIGEGPARKGHAGKGRVAARLAVAGLLALSLGGCAGLGLPFGEAGAPRTTASIKAPRTATARPMLASATVIENVDPSDWETVRREVAGVSETTNHLLDWINPDTGSAGTVSVAAATQRDGVLCRDFATTINDVRGIRRYRGAACLRTDGRWQLRDVIPDDAAIS
jgi:surface antigen